MQHWNSSRPTCSSKDCTFDGGSLIWTDLIVFTPAPVVLFATLGSAFLDVLVSSVTSVTTFLGTGFRLTPHGVAVAGPLPATVRTVRFVTTRPPDEFATPGFPPRPPIELIVAKHTQLKNVGILKKSSLKIELPEKCSGTRICLYTSPWFWQKFTFCIIWTKESSSVSDVSSWIEMIGRKVLDKSNWFLCWGNDKVRLHWLSCHCCKKSWEKERKEGKEKESNFEAI